MKKLCMLVVSFLLLVTFVFAEGEKKVVTPVDVAKELIQWTYEQNVGLTYMFDIDKDKSYAGAKWEFFKSKHDWLRAGLCAAGIGEGEQLIGAEVSFNLGKLIEKIKGTPMVYLKHLEVGYYVAHNLDSHESQDGLILNVIKIQF
jgi:hypothetical protein